MPHVGARGSRLVVLRCRADVEIRPGGRVLKLAVDVVWPGRVAGLKSSSPSAGCGAAVDRCVAGRSGRRVLTIAVNIGSGMGVGGRRREHSFASRCVLFVGPVGIQYQPIPILNHP